MRDRENILCDKWCDRAVSRVQAAHISCRCCFDETAQDGRMPKPTRINARTVWDRVKLDEAFAALSDSRDGDDPWDKVACEE